MSSDGKPLWGFRVIFALLGILGLVSGVWFVHDLCFPSPRFQEVNPPGSSGYLTQVVAAPVTIALGIAWLWFWKQLDQGKLTRRNWNIGWALLLPVLPIFPFGLVIFLCWFAKTCRNFFKDSTERVVPN